MTGRRSREVLGVGGWEPIERRHDPAENAEIVRLRVASRADDPPRENDVVGARYHRAVSGKRSGVPGIVWVGGVGGGVTGPAGGMYPRLAQTLAADGVSSLRVDYRHPRELEPSILDCAIGVSFLRAEGIGPVALVGHSSGGAVVITVGAVLSEVATVVALATQTYGTDLANRLAPASLLLVHGLDDQVLPAACSIEVRRRASTRVELRLLEGAGHSFERKEDDANAVVLEWLRAELGVTPPALPR